MSLDQRFANIKLRSARLRSQFKQYTTYPQKGPRHQESMKRAGIAAIALLTALLLALASPHALWAQAPIVDLYYVPLPEQDISSAFEEINSVTNPPINTTISIAIGGPTAIYYDQWENGYEAVINVPTNIFSTGELGCPSANEGGTQIWGNNNSCDGTAPGFSADTLDNGDVIILSNPVTVPRNPAQILFDGSDKIGASYPIAVTKLSYPSTPGPVLAGGAEIIKTTQWGTTYRAPVGQDVSSATGGWQYTRLFVMAGSNGTALFKNGVSQGVLNEGQNKVIAVNVNDLITTSQPVQVNLITGDANSSYEMRWYTLPSLDSWSDEYFMQVGQRANDASRKVAVWFYNPSQSLSITVNWQIGGTSGSMNVPARQAKIGPYIGGGDGRDGARFFTSGAPFYALSQVDAASGGELYDWGFPLIPSQLLSAQVLIGNGIGCTQPGTTLGDDSCTLGNTDNARSFVWVMPTSGANVPIYVAYDGRPPVCPAAPSDYDETFTLNALRIRTLQEAADLDMTGARIWTCTARVALAVAWGQDPVRSYSGDDQGLDLGTLVIPLPPVQVQKSAAFASDADSDDAISPGDSITYTVAIVNNGAYPATFTVSDTLPSGVTYVAGTTIYVKGNGAKTFVPDNTSPKTTFPLDEGGLSQIGANPLAILPGEVQTVQYLIQINLDTDCTLTLVNHAVIEETVSRTNSHGSRSTRDVIVLACNPGIDVEKSTNGQDADKPTGPLIPAGAPVQWTYVVTNIGDVGLTNVSLSDDKVGGITTGCSPAIPAVFAIGATFTCTKNGVAASGQYENVAQVTATSVISAAQQVSDNDPSHYFGQSAAISIRKFTNGHDANIPIGPQILVGDPVTWTYQVRNTGNVTLNNVSVTDDKVGAIPCPKSTLQPSEMNLCTKLSVATVAGQYSNTATVQGTPPVGGILTDNDPSHYFGIQPELVIKKFTNGHDADTLATAPVLIAGELVTWTYIATNTGNVPLTISVSDDHSDVNVVCPRVVTLPGSSLKCFAFGVAAEGQYTNTGTATATYLDQSVSDSDPSHYIADPPAEVNPSIFVKKFTNFYDADLPPGPFIQVGDTVTWTYFIFNSGSVALTNVSLNDNPLGPVTCPTDELGPFAFTICEVTGSAVVGQYANTATAQGVPPDGPPVTASDPSHYSGVQAKIEIKKYTNGIDADTPTGPLIVEGDLVTWTYVVSNTGNVTLTLVHVTDDQSVVVTCPQIELSPGERMTCQGDPGIAQLGQYANTATVTGLPPAGDVVTDSDPSHYFGEPPFVVQGASITIKKYTNGVDADTPTGPVLLVGDPVNWTYVVTNTGIVVLNNVTVTDNRGVPVTCPTKTLASTQTMTCTARSLAIAGQYTNTGTVVGTPPEGPVVTASDPSHYLGAQPAMELKKYTNGVDADTPTGPLLVTGLIVHWDYVLSNTGNVPLQSFAVTDVPQGPTACPRIGVIFPHQAVVCALIGTAQPGQYRNDSTAIATPAIGGPLNDSDPSHYFGVDASIELKKFTNGFDADLPPGPEIEAGSTVVWTYVVTNTSNVTLIQVAVNDDQLGPVTCPKTVLAPNEPMTCTMTGIAELGQYTNTADVIAFPPAGVEVVDSDPSHYFGLEPTDLPQGEQPERANDLFLPFVNGNVDRKSTGD